MPLSLTRKVGERIVIDKDITITIKSIRGKKVMVNIDAPRDRIIAREERWGLGPAEPVAEETSPSSAA